jgi:tRNA threonylcarbamoyladenosine biosynthesis protein TsaE
MSSGTKGFRLRIQKNDLPKFCEQFLKSFHQKQLILIEGELGAGKTTLVQECARVLGFADAESPTFSIINEYPTEPKIIHADLYRTETAEDVESTGFWDVFLEESAFIFVEWAARVPAEEWPRTWSPIQLQIQLTDKEDEREIIVSLL